MVPNPIHCSLSGILPRCHGGFAASLHTFDGGINPRIHTDFVVRLVSHLFEREVARIYVGDAAFANHDWMEDSASDGHQSRIDANRCLLPDHGHAHLIALERNFCAELLECSLVDVDAPNVVTEQKLVGIAASSAVIDGLEGEDVKQKIAPVQELAHTLAAR